MNNEDNGIFKALFDTMPDGALIADIETKKLILGNNSICNMLGCGKDELQKMTVDDIHSKNDLRFAVEMFEKASQKESGTVDNLTMIRKDGSVFIACVNTSRVIIDGRACLIGIFRDVTDRNNIERELNNRVRDMERFSKFTADRELKMEKLEKRIKELERIVRDTGLKNVNGNKGKNGGRQG